MTPFKDEDIYTLKPAENYCQLLYTALPQFRGCCWSSRTETKRQASPLLVPSRPLLAFPTWCVMVSFGIIVIFIQQRSAKVVATKETQEIRNCVIRE
jgi:hypothetical protein